MAHFRSGFVVLVCLVTIPLEGIPPGRYDCQVSVLDPTGAKATFWRAPIVIIP